MERNLLQLCADLNSGQYIHGSYDYRIVNEKKRRDIAVATVRDRVLHRLVYDYLVSQVDLKLDYDVWSCRKGKGLHQALLRTSELATKCNHGWVWRSDITKFFDSVDQTILQQCLGHYIDDEKAQTILDKVISSYPPELDRQTDRQTDRHGTGIPIGNLTSQIFANIYLNEFDRFVRHNLNPLGYVRYGDDFVLFFNTQNEARSAQEVSTIWLNERLKLHVHETNNIVVRTTRGLHFLGHTIYPLSPVTIEKQMIKILSEKITVRNASTYTAMYIPRRHSKNLPWIIKEIIDGKLDSS